MSFAAENEKHEWCHSIAADEGGAVVRLVLRLVDIGIEPL
jgi:hypothetical protein